MSPIILTCDIYIIQFILVYFYGHCLLLIPFQENIDILFKYTFNRLKIILINIII